MSSVFASFAPDLLRRAQAGPVADPDSVCPFEDAHPLACATQVSFGGFNNRCEGGTCYIVGRGPTEFHYEDLANVSEPIFFINDAICLEKYATAETFFFAHDAQLRPWLDGSIRATAVLPIDGAIIEGVSPGSLRHAGKVVYYLHRGGPDARDLLRMSRNEVADWQKLVVHTGTIHSLLHFVWFCGFRRVVLIGCDGINPNPASAPARDTQYGYDRRLKNRSSSSPGWYYHTIRHAQDLLATLLGLEMIYQGTPSP